MMIPAILLALAAPAAAPPAPAVERAAVANFYRVHRRDYDIFAISHLLIRVDARTPAPAARRRIAALAARAKAGTPFADLARRYSQDTDSASQGGVVPEMRGSVLAPAFRAAVLALKPGQITAPVRSEHGYHILRLDKLTIVPLAQIYPWVKGDWQQSARAGAKAR